MARAASSAESRLPGCHAIGLDFPAVTRNVRALLEAPFAALFAAALAAACQAGAPPPTPPIVPGTATAPREVNIVAKDWLFVPDPVELVPGETVLLHVLNGGLEIHEAVIGGPAVQAAWEAAESATVGHPPGPTPPVSVPPELAGLRVVVRSGERIDVVWTVPAGAAGEGLLVGCHIPGHWAKGMVVAVRLVDPVTGP